MTPGRAIATCGHDIAGPFAGHDVIRRTVAREGGRALSHETWCDACFADPDRRGETFANDAEAEQWLRGDRAPNEIHVHDATGATIARIVGTGETPGTGSIAHVSITSA